MPLPNEHSCRLKDPKQFKKIRRSNCAQKYEGKCIDVIYGIRDVKSAQQAGYNFSALPYLSQRLYNAGEFAFRDGKVFQAIKPTRANQPPNETYWKLVSEIQSLRFKTKDWSASAARAVCKKRGGTFEPAAPKKKTATDNQAPQSACSFVGEVALGDYEIIATAEGPAKKYDLEILPYSGGIIKNHWFWGNVAFDLKGLKFDKEKMPILEEHIRENRIGFSVEQSITNQVEVKAKFLSNPLATRMKQDITDGFPMQASLLNIPEVIEYVMKDSSVKVNNITLEGPGAVFRQSTIREVSLCTLGADKETRAAIAAKDNIKIEFNVVETEGSSGDMDMNQLTAENIADDRPDLLEEIRSKAAKEVRDQFEEFVTKLGDDPALCIEQFKAGKTIEEATAAQCDRLKEKNAKLAEEAKEAKEKTATAAAKVDPAKQEFTDKQTETTGGKGEGSELKGEAKWKDQFAKSEELQDQFKTEEAYIAFQKHDEAGEVHITGRKE